jgi:hypothetical protein
MRISRNYEVEDYTSLQFVDEVDWRTATAILRDRLETRYLEHVRAILKRPTSGFAVLAIDSALIETLEQFRRGRPSTPSREGATYFRAFLTKTRFRRHFNDQTAKLFYKTIRCGLLHQGEADESSRIKRGNRYALVSLTKDRRGIVVNAEHFHSELESAVRDYLTRPADPTEVQLRQAFRKKMDYICRKEPQTRAASHDVS